MEDKIIGPALPPHLLSSESSINDENSSNHTITESKCFDNKSLSLVSDAGSSQTSDSDVYGPVLPPHLKKQSEGSSMSPKKVVGPSLPVDLDNVQYSSAGNSSEDEDNIVGPPVPSCVTSTSELSLTQQKLEMRAQYLKRKMADEGSGEKTKNVKERESWMLELPPEKRVNLGLEPRSFRKREGPDMKDRSDWTDTPADRLRKQMLGQESGSSKREEDIMKEAAINERDKVMEKMAETCKDEKRQLSLLEMHQKEILKKQKKEKKKRGDKPPERRPFDRDIDLQANRFDEAQKKSIFKKARLLDTRFSSGQSKYL